MGAYESYRETELEAASGAGRLGMQEARRLVDRAVHSSVNGVVITDATMPDNPIVYVNPAFEQITGFSAGEALGENCRFLQGLDTDQPALAELRAAIKEGRECQVVLRNYKKCGTLFWNELSISPVHDEEGRLTNFVGVQNDITERKRAEDELRFQKALLEAQSEASMEGILVVSSEGKIISVNRRYVEMWGIPEEVMALRSREAVLREIQGKLVDPQGFLSRIAHLYEHPGEEGRDELLLKDGRTFDRYSAPIRGKDGVYYGRVWYFRDITESKRAEEVQRFLAEAGAALSSSLDYRATLASVARLSVPYLADWCAVDVLEEDGSLDRVAVVHQDPEKVALAHELQERYPPDPEAPYGVSRVLRTGRSELVSEISQSLLDEAVRDAEHRGILRKLGLRSYVVVPLVARGRTLGAISLVSAESGRRYGPADLQSAEELARRAALAVDNARLYRERSRTVRALQGSLLPSRLPDVPGLEVGLRYLPAGEVDVGGDFYDLFDARIEARNGDTGSSRPSSSWGVVIGDVCGKGADAAAILALARYTIRASAMHKARPSAILADLNEAMLRQKRERNDHKFCTVAYARFKTKGGAKRGARGTVCRGGHPPPVLLGADGSIHKIGYPGHAIGVFDDPRLIEQEVLLAPGDALVFYTDGVVEARSPDGAFFGEERLVSLLRSCAGLDASALAGRIESTVLDFQENGARDDLAVLVLRVSP